ncbi:MAG: LysR family transcriptional regulator [Rhodocyclaceae bacterium]
MPINELRAISTFAKAVELGSLRKAAAAQGMTPQAVSQMLAQLEAHLGVRLLHRTTRNIALTDEGRQFLESAQPALAALERALQQVRRAKDDDAGPLRIVGPRSTFLPVLWPVVDEFCQRYPGVEPDVLLDDRIGNWVQDRVDVGFRFGMQPDEGVIGRRLFPLQMIVCAAPAYLARHGAPDTLEELDTHRCTVFRHPVTGRLMPWTLGNDSEAVSRDMAPALSTNDSELEVEAVLSGHTLGLLTGTSVAHHIRQGRLVPLLHRYATARYNVFIYYGNRKAQPARVRAFIDLAIERLMDNPAYFLQPDELAEAEAEGRRRHVAGR